MSITAPGSGLVLSFGCCVLFLCWADDVGVLSDTSQGLQPLITLIDGMYAFCVSMGLTISVANTEVVLFHGAAIQGSWCLHGLVLPRSLSFKYLGVAFHKSGLSPM